MVDFGQKSEKSRIILFNLKCKDYNLVCLRSKYSEYEVV